MIKAPCTALVAGALSPEQKLCQVFTYKTT